MNITVTDHMLESPGSDTGFAFVVDIVDTTLSVVGFVLNAAALVAFIKNDNSFGFPIKHLLLHQSFLDMITCFMSTVIHLQPTYWHVSNYYWEVINCYLWHSQYFFWYFLYTSANNLVYLAYDRYRAVVHPLHYKDISKSRLSAGFLLVHLYSFLVRWPSLLNIRMDGDICVAGWVIKGKYAKLTSNLYGVFEFVVHYLVHMIALLILYGKVIQVSRKVMKREDDTTSSNTQKALSVVTRASIAVTIVFILTFSWIFWNYTPGVLFGWFAVGSPWQKTNVMMGAINSACNPVFYYLFMPSFRRALSCAFFPCVSKDRHENLATVSTVSTSTFN